MADKDKDTPVERVILIDAHEQARRAAEERQRALDAGEVEAPDKTVPGGKYKAPDGRWHDAHGREITESGELASETQYELPDQQTTQIGGPEVTDAAKAGENDEGDEAWRADMKDQRRESMANPVEGAPILGDTVLPPLDDDVEEVDETTGTKRRVKRRRSK